MLLRPRQRRLSSGEIRRRADLAALRLVAAYGHCTISDWAHSIYPNGKYATQSAQRLAKRLCGHSPPLCAVRRNSLAGRSFVLTRPGAAYLEVRGVQAHHGMDLDSVAGPTFRHHAIVSRFCQVQELAGVKAWTEYAISQGQAPLSQREVLELCGKVPDAILLGPTGELTAVECESSPKGFGALKKAIKSVERAGHVSIGGITLAGCVFVFDASQNHRGRIARVAKAVWKSLQPEERAALVKRISLASAEIGYPLVFRSWRTEPLVLPPVATQERT
jgi:hypothetical protein